MNQRSDDTHKQFQEVSFASTRVVQLGDGQVVALSPETLENMARQINEGPFLPVRIEHLGYLPPLGRIASARLEPADDGALVLIGVIEQLPHVSLDDDPSGPIPLAPTLGSSLAQDATPSFHLLLEPRNFEPADFAELVALAPVPVRRQAQWAELPPLEVLLVLQVTTGLTIGLAAFWKKFMEELGTQAGKAFADWIRSVRQRAKAPERDLMLAARFDLPSGAIITGYIPIPVGSENTIEPRLSAWVDLAWFAEQVPTNEDANLQQMTFIHDGEQWRLAWYITTGEAIYITKWGQENTPDAVRFLPTVDSGASIRHSARTT